MPKYKIDKNTLLITSAILVVFLTCYLIYYKEISNILERLYNSFPSYVIMQVIFINFIFLFTKYLNDKVDFSAFNSYSKYSYCFMLIHHVILFAVLKAYNPLEYSKFGLLIFMIIIFLVTLFLSVKTTNMYKPVEEKIINKFCD